MSPTPWTAESGVHGTTIRDANGDSVADAICNLEDEALILAAPALLKALKDIMRESEAGLYPFRARYAVAADIAIQLAETPRSQP